MDAKALEGAVLRLVLTELARKGEKFVPVNASNRHAHLSQPDVERLFGPGYHLTRMRDLGQPGQYACNESVTIECEKGSLSLRVVGPARKETQVELSFTDCAKLGVKPALRMSGDTAGTPGCALASGDRRILIDHGVIVAARHLHMSESEAEGFGLADGDVVALEVGGPRAAVLENLVVRSGPGHSLEAHIDRDEANACGLTDGQLCHILCAPQTGAAVPQMRPPVQELKTYQPAPKPQPREAKSTLFDLSAEKRRFLSEEDVLTAARDGYKVIRCGADAVVTPLARDAASAKGVELIQLS